MTIINLEYYRIRGGLCLGEQMEDFVMTEVLIGFKAICYDGIG